VNSNHLSLQLTTLVPVQFCPAEYGTLTVIPDERDNCLEGGNDTIEKGIEAHQITENIQFGLFSQLLEAGRGKVIVLTSIGKQSTEKSYY